MNQLTPLKRGEGRLETKLSKTKRWPIFREREHNRDTMEKNLSQQGRGPRNSTFGVMALIPGQVPREP